MTFRSMSLPLFAFVAALAGCSAEAGTSSGVATADEARSSVAAETADSSERKIGMRPIAHRPAGPDFLLRAALRAPIDLTPEQRKTIEGLVEQTRPPRPQFDASRAQKLAAAIRNNSVAELEAPKPDESAFQAHLAASAKALATLHATLTPAQRAALVDSIGKPAKGEKLRAGERGARRAHGARGGHLKGGFGGPGPMGMLAGIELTAEQKKALEAKLEVARPAQPTAEQREAMKARMESMRAERKAKLESFKSDNFDANAFVAPPKDLPRPEWTPKNPLAEIVPLLTPEQRETLAARIEKGPAAFHPMKGSKVDAIRKVK